MTDPRLATAEESAAAELVCGCDEGLEMLEQLDAELEAYGQQEN